MKDYLAYASDCLENAQLDFEPVAYPTAADALDAMKKGEVDCVFPANLSGYDGETMGVVMTPSMVSTEVYAVVRQTDQNIFAERDHVIVAVNEGNPNYDAVLLDHFPIGRKVYYPDHGRLPEGVSEEGVADCVLISNYRYNNISRLCERYHLTALTTGVGVDYCFAVGKGNTELYSILRRWWAWFRTHGELCAVVLRVGRREAHLCRLHRGQPGRGGGGHRRAGIGYPGAHGAQHASGKKAKELIAATEIDKLTGLYNRSYFFQYANRMFDEHPDTPMDAIVLNIERFHSVNALNGRMFGDQVLRALGNEVHEIAKESNGIAGRFEADRFDIYCQHTEDYQAVLRTPAEQAGRPGAEHEHPLAHGRDAVAGELEPVQLFDRARTACSMARGHYKEHLIVFDEKVRDREMYEQRLLNDLRRALDAYEFEVYYQPKFDIQSEPPQLVGAEALVRWRHPELGMILPDGFIPLFERSGAIGDVDKYVWEAVAKQIARWQGEYGVTGSRLRQPVAGGRVRPVAGGHARRNFGTSRA